MFETTPPKTLLKWLVLAGIAYVVLPFDLIPDVLGLPGRVDDLVALALLGWSYRNHLKRFARGPSQQGEGKSEETRGSKPFDAYEVLKVARGASPDAIRDAYHARMREYHPDKVAHLGEALQKLAHEKAQEIERAYREIGSAR